MKFKYVDKKIFSQQYNKYTNKELSKLYNVTEQTIINWAKNLKLPCKHNSWKNFTLSLSTYQESIIIGSLLGDASLCFSRKKTAKSNARLSELHKKNHLEYLKWKQNQLINIPSHIYYKKTIARKNIGNGKIISDSSRYYESYQLQTIVHPYFTNLYNKWYKFDKKTNKYKKIIPENLKLNMTSFSIWFFDDGCTKKNNIAHIYTLNFQLTEIEILQKLINKLNYNCQIKKFDKNKEQYFLSFSVNDTKKLKNDIKKSNNNIPNCMKYKIN